MYEETTWPTNKYSPGNEVDYMRRERPTKTRIFIAEITKFETPVYAQQQINNRNLRIFSKTFINLSVWNFDTCSTMFALFSFCPTIV